MKKQPPTAPNAPAAPMRVQTVPYIEESALRQLQQLYKLQPQNPSRDGEQPDTIGTLPATSMDAVVAHFNKVRLGNTLSPPSTKSPTPHRNAAKITADLMDIDLWSSHHHRWLNWLMNGRAPIYWCGLNYVCLRSQIGIKQQRTVSVIRRSQNGGNLLVYLCSVYIGSKVVFLNKSMYKYYKTNKQLYSIDLMLINEVFA